MEAKDDCGAESANATFAPNQVDVTTAAHPQIPNALEVIAEITLDSGWYTSSVDLFARQGALGTPDPLGPMYYKSQDPTGTKEIWVGTAYQTTGGGTTYIVEAELTSHQSQRIAGQT